MLPAEAPRACSFAVPSKIMLWQHVVDLRPLGGITIESGQHVPGLERGTLSTGYELCVGPHGFGTSLQNFAKFRRLRIAGSWYQRPELHR